jgi:hypothetical protein
MTDPLDSSFWKRIAPEGASTITIPVLIVRAAMVSMRPARRSVTDPLVRQHGQQSREAP